ncbi:hypothetical protein [Actinomadura rubrisoli]|uniref:NTP pyrophosphohydrolase MazG putative catalytic core domain-containing protein n=1 Tax=Actinomadura rubrisoli TaxID=2530368 RepID=A0A4R5AS21_9ACTN|nr:hypothetical protein [Actinomadura rubrisoli]TDD75065.1 hypothetical protein E1298_31905 [Actinomadura rubrisoli]
MEPLRFGASLRDVQDYVIRLEDARGFSGRSAADQSLKLVEELGEACRAVGKLQGQPTDPTGRVNDLGAEAVDALLMLVAVINRFDIDLQRAYADQLARQHLHGQRTAPPAVTSLRDLQDYVAKRDAECGQWPVEIRSLLLVAQIGRLCSAVAVTSIAPAAGNAAELGAAATEGLTLLASVVTGYGIDLEDAFRRKEKHNDTREWR